MTVQEAKRIIREDPGGNIMARLEAIEVAKEVLGEDLDTGKLHRWADKEDGFEEVNAEAVC